LPFVDSPFADSPFADSPYADSPLAGSPFVDSPFVDSPFAGSILWWCCAGSAGHARRFWSVWGFLARPRKMATGGLWRPV